MPFPYVPDSPIPDSTAPCHSCGKPTVNGADIDINDGRGFVRKPICDTDCLQDVMARASGPGSQMRARFPSASD